MSDDDSTQEADMAAVDYPPHIAALLEDARPLDAPPSSVKAAIKARVQQSVGAASSVAAANASASVGAGSYAGKLWFSVAVVGAAIVALLLARRPAEQSNTASDGPVPVASHAMDASTAHPVLAVPVVNHAPTVAEDSGAVLSPPATEPAVLARRPTVQEPADTLAEERRLLDAARDKLGADDPSGALSLLSLHAQRYARGTLSMEREALRVRALVMANRREDARSAADRFVARWPSSALRSAVEAMVR